MRIQSKMLLFILATTAIIYIAAIGIISLRFRNMSVENSKKIVDTYVREYANSVETSLNEDMSVARTMAQAFAGYESIPSDQRDQIYNQILENILFSNPRYIAVFLQFELSAIEPGYTKPYGRLRKALHWTDPINGKNGATTMAIDTLETDGDDTDGIYYGVKTTGIEIITNPYFYSYTNAGELPSEIPTKSDAILESTVIVPIKIDGKFVGLTGMDIPLNSFQEILCTIKPYKKSYAFLIANDGSFVAHPILENITGSISEIDSVYNVKYDLMKKIRHGQSFSFVDWSPVTNEKTYLSIAPVFIGNTEKPWAIGISVPLKVIMAPALKSFYIAITIGLVGLVLLSIIIWVISRNITRPLIKTTSLLKDLARGSIDNSSYLKVKTTDEIGEMTVSANTLVEFLQTTSDFAKQIGEGNLDADYHLLSDDDILGWSLIEMRNKLKESKEKIETQAKKLILSNRELEKLSVVASETDNAIIIMDEHANVEWVNEGLVRLYEFSFEEFIEIRGDNITKISTNPAIHDILNECIETKKSVHYTSENLTKSGKIVWAQTTMTPILDDAFNVIKLVTIDSDITQIKIAEREISKHLVEIRKQKEELEELNATKDRFFAILAHDLRNPFTAVHSIIQSLLTSFDDLETDEHLFYIDRVSQIASHIVTLLDNLLLWARSQSGKMLLHTEKLEINELVEENLVFAKAIAEKKGINLSSDLPPGVLAYGDRNMINTVLRNLISNAIKYTETKGSVTVSARNVQSEDNKAFVEILVSDSGIGIKEKHLNKLFRIDQNPSTRGTSDEKGTGLGLLICKEFVEKNGGTIRVNSKETVGSDFIFTLPVVSA